MNIRINHQVHVRCGNHLDTRDNPPKTHKNPRSRMAQNECKHSQSRGIKLYRSAVPLKRWLILINSRLLLVPTSLDSVKRQTYLRHWNV